MQINYWTKKNLMESDAVVMAFHIFPKFFSKFKKKFECSLNNGNENLQYRSTLEFFNPLFFCFLFLIDHIIHKQSEWIMDDEHWPYDNHLYAFIINNNHHHRCLFAWLNEWTWKQKNLNSQKVFNRILDQFFSSPLIWWWCKWKKNILFLTKNFSSSFRRFFITEILEMF
mgnify:CR=1 FL=1